MTCVARQPRGLAGRLVAVLLGCLVWPEALAEPLFRTNDCVALLGGASVVAVDRAGLLETALTLAHPGHKLRFRALAWEGDTVFVRPRELNFPTAGELLKKSGTTIACLEFGSLEALDRSVQPEAFREAYGRMLDEIRSVCPRIALVIPPPFEPKPPPLPDVTAANERLERLAAVIRGLGAERRLPVIDVHGEFLRGVGPGPWTHDGRELTPLGQRWLAAAWVRQAGRVALADRVRDEAFWKRAEMAALLRAVQDKSRLWFDAWRPMNWAFLAGDRTEQQASRDHRDPRIRWFPAEMEQYPALIAEAEIRIESLASQIRLEP